VPGIIIGLTLAVLLNIIAYIGIYMFSRSIIPYNLYPGSVYFGVAFSICLPIVSNILPIKQALGNTLRESLDVHRQSLTDFKVVQIRLAEIGLSPP
jgi:ABC-type lipoprotein release transport system permease subunit